MRKKRKKAWLAALICLFWTVWLERNRIVFDEEEIFLFFFIGISSMKRNFPVYRMKNSFFFPCIAVAIDLCIYFLFGRGVK